MTQIKTRDVARTLTRLREARPLVHNMTNEVATYFTANGLLAIGASPVMAYAMEEVADLAKAAGALVLNIGTLTGPLVEAMLAAGRSANRHGVPVILDPVGAGATAYRTETSRTILREVEVSVLRGNAAEVANVIGEAWAIRGVDAGEGSGDVASLARTAAGRTGCLVVVTGPEDAVSNGEETYAVANGHPILTKVTATGCLLSSVIGAFRAVESDGLLAAVAAAACYGIAAELAAERAPLPGSFPAEFLNRLHTLSEAEVERMAAIRRVEA